MKKKCSGIIILMRLGNKKWSEDNGMEQVHLSRGDTYEMAGLKTKTKEKKWRDYHTMVTVGGTKSYFSLHPSIHL